MNCGAKYWRRPRRWDCYGIWRSFTSSNGGAPAELVDDVRLVVSELVTNSVAVRRGGTIVFEMYALAGAVMVGVWDPVEEGPVRRAPGTRTGEGC